MPLRRGYPDDLAEGPHVAALGEYMAGMPMTEVAALHRTLREKHPGLPPVVMPLPQRTRVSDARSFAAVNQSPLVAGNYAYCHLWNPADSGVSLEVHVARATTTTAATYMCLTTVAALLGGVDLGAGWRNLYLGGAVSVAHFEIGNVPAPPGGGSVMWRAVPVSSGATFEDDVVVPPGNGLVLYNGNVAQNLWGEFVWSEVD